MNETENGLDVFGDASPAAAYVEAVTAAFEAIKHGSLQVLDSQLAGIYLNQFDGASLLTPFAATMGALSSGADFSGGYVTIDATAKDQDGAALLAALQGIGLIAGGAFGSMASGLLPVSQVQALVQIGDLAFARQSGYVPSAGLANNQGDHAMVADTARSTYGVDGSGVKIGILSDSFNHLNGMNADIASGDLPFTTTILQDLSGSGTDEGRAMAQMAHDIAPGAAISFATAYTGMANFANNILALASSGAKIIVDDVIYFAETAYQDGVIAQAIDQVTASGVAYFSAAGNNANKAFEASFVDSGVAGSFGESLATLTTGAKPQFLSMTVPGGRTVTIVLQWNQPAASVSGAVGSQSDVDLFVYNAAGSSVLYQSIADNLGGDPLEIVQFTNTGATTTYNLAVGLYSGVAPSDFKVMVLDNGAGVTLGSSSLNTNSGTIYGHAAASGAIAVGAAYYQQTPAYGVSPPVLESFSSYGSTRIYFDTAGNALASPDIRLGPQFVATDGGDTTFFGNDRDGNGRPNFSGTSAAAPDAAAVAALMLQANSLLSPGDIRNLLSDSAIDMDNPATAGFATGFDSATGYGLIQADKAVQYAVTGIIALNATHGVVLGTHLNDIFTGGAGNHSITGGAGIDTLDYSSASAAVNLAAGSGGNGFGGTDIFSGIEKVLGTSLGDIIIGGAGSDSLAGNGGNDSLDAGDGADSLDGGTGADSLNGGAADDTLAGSAGNDSFDGGDGNDRAIYSGLWSDYRIVKTGVASFSLIDGRGGAPDGSDALLNVEMLYFSDVLAISADAAVAATILSFSVDGGITGDLLTGDSDLLLSGNAGAASLINIFDGSLSLGLVSADGAGLWTFQTGVLGAGTHSFSAAATDGAGHWGVLSSVFSITLDLTADGGAPAGFVIDATDDDLINRTEAFSVQFSVTGLDSDATATASFTDGTHVVQIGGIAANGTYTADLSGLDDAAIQSALTIGDSAGNQLIVSGNGLLLGPGAVIAGTGEADVIDGEDAPIGQHIATKDNDTVDGQGGADTIFGLSGDDALSGGSGADSLEGGIGNDLLDGGDDDDTMHGGAGNDSLIGGLGADTAVYSGFFSDYTLAKSGGAITVVDGRTDSPDGADTLVGIENIQFAGGVALLSALVNAPPQAVSDAASAVEAAGINNGTLGSDPTGNVLDNDTDPNSGDTKEVQGVASGLQSGPLSGGVGAGIAGTYGTLVLNADGGFTYTVDNTKAAVQALNVGGQLSDVFTYTMRDSSGADSSATLTVAIDGANDAPSALVDTNIAANGVAENAANGAVVGITAFASDADSASLTYSLIDNAGGRFAINPASGVVTVANGALLDFETASSHAIAVQVSDGVLMRTQSFSIAVANVAGGVIAGRASADIVDATRTVAGQLRPTGEEDSINGSGGNDSIEALGGNDTINGGTGADTMLGGAGNDRYIVDNLGDLITENPDEGIDSVQSAVSFALGADFENLTLTGSAANSATGNAAANVIIGNTGSNVLAGLGGADSVYGGAGADTATYGASPGGVTVSLLTGAGTGGDAQGDVLSNIENLSGSFFGDSLHGSSGNNSLFGNDGSDTLDGDAGNDTLDGGAGADSMAGGLGNDTYVVDDTSDVIAEAVGAGTDTVKASAVNYTLAGNVEALTFTSATGSAGLGNDLANTLTGFSGNDTLDGGLGNDKLLGGLGDDQLLGGAGNDSLTGGAGADTMTGGIGADRFIFTAQTEFAPGPTLDLIADCSHAQADKIDLSTIDANTGLIGNQAFVFIGTAVFGSHAGELRYEVSSADVVVSGDIDGNGVADFSFKVAAVGSLVAGDFVL